MCSITKESTYRPTRPTSIKNKMSVPFSRGLSRQVASCLQKNPLHAGSARNYARLSLIGNLVQDARVIERGGDKDPMVALKVATADRQGRDAKEAGKEPTSSFHDVLSFNPGLNKYLAEFKKGFVHTPVLIDPSFRHLISPGISKFFLGWVNDYCHRSLVHIEAEVRMQPQEQTDPQNYQPAVVRLTLREINKLRNPKSE
ncbi:hypothetical protein PSHT_09239 [Puccinia striiformis]|uniref:Uncharacterized protein n=1 Tax=Puccinia striiformis TaxID=27350 RepID=A0A2S4VHZ2_9BASI|nr:hypothetical protein PSHT_09239 [Puccinia striiformis]